MAPISISPSSFLPHHQLLQSNTETTHNDNSNLLLLRLPTPAQPPHTLTLSKRDLAFTFSNNTPTYIFIAVAVPIALISLCTILHSLRKSVREERERSSAQERALKWEQTERQAQIDRYEAQVLSEIAWSINAQGERIPEQGGIAGSSTAEITTLQQSYPLGDLPNYSQRSLLGLSLDRGLAPALVVRTVTAGGIVIAEREFPGGQREAELAQARMMGTASAGDNESVHFVSSTLETSVGSDQQQQQQQQSHLQQLQYREENENGELSPEYVAEQEEQTGETREQGDQQQQQQQHGATPSSSSPSSSSPLPSSS